ncbi:helix-turn-helix domain-containing protein [Sphaerisporangium sp. B11E5]|uniref:TetR/AcrR family transcriptional regulator n=1 Tax=Sphaerisporangium sp. B11E5 TaxID=3153563 RepID=UPI00325EE741
MARRADATRNAALLLAAARELFDEHGPEVPLDDIARHAGVANATLYRHFPTRGDLLVAVYAEEVTALTEHGTALLRAPSPADALFEWLDVFVTHVTTKRPLALAATEGTQRAELFTRWHESMRSAARALLRRAQDQGTVRPGITADDLLSLANAAAVTARDVPHARHLLRLLRHGCEEARP